MIKKKQCWVGVISPLLILIGIIGFIGCEEKPTIEGLWIVKSVIVGEENMTPNARWMKFNSDSTQQSGNGWFQHSIGTWSFNQSTNALTITNTNVLEDPNEPFSVILSDDEMTWKRVEEGQPIVVNLERTIQLPTTYGDQLLGLWSLKESTGSTNYSTPLDTVGITDYVFFRWDKRFVIGTEKGRIRGVYQVHGHRPEVELIPYTKAYTSDTWGINFNGEQITLNLLDTDSVVTRTFKRIHEFPK